MLKNSNFGERVVGYEMPVFNARELRAGTGILLLIGMLAFAKAFFTQDFTFANLFVTYFMIDFAMRLFIAPKFAPSLIIGHIFVQDQSPEYVGASQKKFAWSLAFAFAVTMFVVIVLMDLSSSIKMSLGTTLLILLFCEAIFGICLGCKLYPLFTQQASICEGDSCGIKIKEPIQEVSIMQYWVALVSIVSFIVIAYSYL